MSTFGAKLYIYPTEVGGFNQFVEIKGINTLIICGCNNFSSITAILLTFLLHLQDLSLLHLTP